MPEGDTIFRTATSLRRWMAGRTVTAARSTVLNLGLERVVGSAVDEVEPRAKHLLIRFSSGDVLHTHMRMTGSWHVYPTGARWKKPLQQMKVVLEAGERTAVLFNAPVVELLAGHEERAHEALRHLGPDVLSPDFDLDEVVRRSHGRPEGQLLGELLLDQQVVSGLGNIYRCESLFLEGLDPFLRRSMLDDDGLRALVTTGRRLIAANAGAVAVSRELGAGADRTWVYGRTGRPCRRCGTAIRTDHLGAQARLVHWCPACQRPVTT